MKIRITIASSSSSLIKNTFYFLHIRSRKNTQKNNKDRPISSIFNNFPFPQKLTHKRLFPIFIFGFFIQDERIRLGYLIEIRQMRPKNCPNFQNFSENRKCALIFFENFSKNRKKPSKNLRLRRKIAKCAFLLQKMRPLWRKGSPK